jgi:hypothetical protein
MVLPELASGAITVWIVPYAIQSLHLGNAGVGYLYSGLGAGMAAGGIITALLASSVRLEPLLAVSVAAGGVAMALFGLFPVIVGALLCIIAMGAAETVKFAAYETLVQQAVPESMIGQASGSLDSLFFNMMLVGNVASGALAAAFGLTPAIAGLGMLTVIGVGAAWWKFRLETARQPDIAALSTIPAFAHLPPELLQWVVRRMVREEFPAGAVIMRQGDPGDRFYALARGSVEVAVTSNGNTMKRRLAPGNVFGEIALLQDIARTATVRTLEPAATYSLSREDFQELQRRATEFKESLLETATARLAEDTNFKMAIATRS